MKNTLFLMALLLGPLASFSFNESTDTAYVDQLLMNAKSELNSSRPAQAYPWIEEARKLSGQANYPRGLAGAHQLLGWYAECFHEWDSASYHYSKALGLWEDVLDSLEIGRTHQYIGKVMEKKGSYAKQEKSFLSSYGVFQAMRDTFRMGCLAIDLGNAAKNLRKIPEAINHYKNAIGLLEKWPDTPAMGAALYNLGELYYHQGAWTDAQQLTEKALLFYKGSAKPGKTAMIYNLMAAISLAGDRSAEAKKHFIRSAELAEEARDSLIQFDALINLAELEILDQNYAKAIANYEMAKEVVENKGNQMDQIALDKIDFGLRMLKKSHTNKRLFFLVGALILFMMVLASWIHRMRLKERARIQTHNFLLRQKDLQHEKELLSLFKEIDAETNKARAEAERGEKKKIKELVHNTIGSQLAATKWKLDSAKAELRQDALTEDALINIWEMVDVAYHNSRNIERLLEKEPTDWLADIDQFFDLLCQNQNGHPKITFLNHAYSRDLPPEKGWMIHHIVQIVTANALKSAKARQFTCQINRAEKDLILVMEDDGVGFDPSAPTDGNGIRNLRAIVYELSGQLEIDSNPGKGTTITVMIPLDTLVEDEQ